MNEKDLALTILRMELNRKRSDYNAIKASLKYYTEEELDTPHTSSMLASDGKLPLYFTPRELLERVVSKIADLENCINWIEKV